jgi:TRAP-type mannitol/chloroaromatic compound transport system substrate-binding protein
VPGAHQPTTTLELAISKEKWVALPANLKAIIKQAAIETTFMAWIKFRQLDMKALDTFEKNGNEIIFLEPAVQQQIHRLGKEWAQTHTAENEWFRKIFDSQEAFEKQWKTVGNIRYLEN